MKCFFFLHMCYLFSSFYSKPHESEYMIRRFHKCIHSLLQCPVTIQDNSKFVCLIKNRKSSDEKYEPLRLAAHEAFFFHTAPLTNHQFLFFLQNSATFGYLHCSPDRRIVFLFTSPRPLSSYIATKYIMYKHLRLWPR